MLAFGAFFGMVLILIPIIALVGIGPPPAAAAAPSDTAVADIPAELLPVYRQAAEDTCRMPWEVLAAIGKIESDHGRSDLPGVKSGTNEAGAAGPMQFLAPTWASFKVDGDRDGDTDIYDPVDSIWSAANYLCSNGAGDRDEDGRSNTESLRAAIRAYNHSDAYVDEVLNLAAAYRQAGEVGTGGDATQLLAHPGFTVYAGGQQDLEQGRIDQRVIDFLLWVLERHTISVSSLKTGHSEYVDGTDTRSHHFFGRGVDISVVDGETVRSSSTAARTLAEEIDGLATGRPDEVGTPWADLADRPGFFTDANHSDHIHVAYGGPR